MWRISQKASAAPRRWPAFPSPSCRAKCMACSARTARANRRWSKSWRDFMRLIRAARLEFNGEHVQLPLKPGDFRRLGMSFVHQNLGLAPVADGPGKSSLRTFDRRAASVHQLARRAPAGDRGAWPLRPDARSGTSGSIAFRPSSVRFSPSCARSRRSAPNAPPPGGPVSCCSMSRRPFCRARASTSCSALMRSIAATGSSVIFISHDIEEVLTITDRITVLRDGRWRDELETARATHDQIVEQIVGRSLARRAEPFTIRRRRLRLTCASTTSPARRCGRPISASARARFSV